MKLPSVEEILRSAGRTFARFPFVILTMSLRFFTNTRVGELMSRLNNDVVGTQNAISNTITNVITNLIQTVAILVIMLTLEWRLTLLSLIVMPFLWLVARRLGARLRVVARQSMDLNAQMNAHMNETLNIGGALLVKLFGRESDEERRFRTRAAGVRDIGVRRAVLGTSLFAVLGIIGAIGTALAYGVGVYLVIQGAFQRFCKAMDETYHRIVVTGIDPTHYCLNDNRDEVNANRQGDQVQKCEPGNG